LKKGKEISKVSGKGNKGREGDIAYCKDRNGTK
jgi:hypothetical protein